MNAQDTAPGLDRLTWKDYEADLERARHHLSSFDNFSDLFFDRLLRTGGAVVP